MNGRHLLLVFVAVGMQLMMTLSLAAETKAETKADTKPEPAEPSSYVSAILSDARLIAHYSLDENPQDTRSVADATSSKNDGELNGNTRAAKGAEVLPKTNRAIDFDGKGMIAVPNKPVDLKQMTLVCFFRSTDTTSKEQRVFTTSKKSRYQFVVMIDQGNLRAIIESPGVGGAGTLTPLSVDSQLDGKWHHLIVSRAGDKWSDVRIWIDFKPADVQEGSWSVKGLLDDQAVIGSRSLHPFSAFHGALDELSFFNTAFTQADVDKLKATLPQIQ